MSRVTCQCIEVDIIAYEKMKTLKKIHKTIHKVTFAMKDTWQWMVTHQAVEQDMYQRKHNRRVSQPAEHKPSQ